MSRNPYQQQKLLRLREIFLSETDETHALTMEEIRAHLARFGISAERKSIYENIQTLNQCGLDILQERRGKQTVYFAAGRAFETAELRLLADAVASSRFITQKKSAQLLAKLGSLTSRWQSAALRRQVYVASRIKNMDETIFYLVDDLNRAISENQAVGFHYFDWISEQGSLRKQPRHHGRCYTVSPWQLLWQDEFYYLIAFDHRAQQIRHYRVDRIGDLTFTGEPRTGEEAFRKIHIEDYTARLFGMFGGETRRIALSFPPRLLEVMVDRFGKALAPQPLPGGKLLIRVDLIPSMPFYGWLFSLGSEVEITAPEDLRNEYCAALRRTLERYGEGGGLCTK